MDCESTTRFTWSHVRPCLAATIFCIAALMTPSASLAARPNELSADIDGGRARPATLQAKGSQTCEEAMVELQKGRHIYPTCEVD